MDVTTLGGNQDSPNQAALPVKKYSSHHRGKVLYYLVVWKLLVYKYGIGSYTFKVMLVSREPMCI